MPFIPQQPISERGTLPKVDEPDAGFVDSIGAAFATHNTLGSMIDRGVKEQFPLNPSSPELSLANDEYDPFDDIKGYEQYPDSFINVESQEEAEYVKMNIDRENSNRQIISDSGASGYVSSFIAGMTDPVMLPLFFMGGGTLSGARSATVAGLKLGVETGAVLTVSEALLHGTQETRTIEESVINISAGTLLTGVIGGAMVGMSKKQISQITKAIDDDLQPSVPTSAGAAAVRQTTKEQETLISAAGLEKVGLSPDVRLSQSESLLARQIKEDLVESSLRKQKNLEGIATAEGGSVETRIKQYDFILGESLTKIDDAYLMYRKGQTGLAAGMKTKVGDLFGARRRSGHLTAKEFREELGRAMIRNDTHAIKEIDSLAKYIRSKVIDPIKNKAIDLKLFAKDIKVKTAPSYFTRVWRPEVVAAKRTELNDIITNWMVRETKDLDALEASSIADDAINNILGHPEGRIPLDIMGKAGPLHERTLLIPDEMIEQFLEHDAEVVLRYYVRTMAPDLELTAKFGSKDMKDQISSISNEYANKVANLKGKDIEKQAAKLNKAKVKDIKDLEALRDMLSGTFGRPADPNDIFYRTSASLRKVNFLSKLGGMTMSAMPDMANHVFAHGFKPVGKALVQMIADPKMFKGAARQVKETGAAWDMVLNTRALSLADVGDSFGRHTMLERGLQSESNRFGLISLMAPWNAAQKQFGGIITTNETLRAISKWSTGTVNRHDRLLMTSSGINKDMAKRIAKEFKAHGQTEKAGLKLPNTNKWKDKEAAQAFRTSVLRQVDEIIVTPGVADRPLVMGGSEVGRHLGQFKSFMFAATNKMAIARMQQRDAEALSGMLLSLALGAMTYASKEAVAGRDISSDPAIVIKEALDRSGMTGWVMEGNNIMEKLTEGKLGLSAMLGGPQSARYYSRNKVGAIAGPTFGTVKDMLDVIGATATGEIGKKERHAIRKLMPYQNLFYIRRWLDGLEDKM